MSCAQGAKLGKAIDTSVVLTVFDISSDLTSTSTDMTPSTQTYIP